MEFCNFFGISKLLFLLFAALCRRPLFNLRPSSLSGPQPLPIPPRRTSALAPFHLCGDVARTLTRSPFPAAPAVLSLLASDSFEGNPMGCGRAKEKAPKKKSIKKNDFCGFL